MSVKRSLTSAFFTALCFAFSAHAAPKEEKTAELSSAFEAVGTEHETEALSKILEAFSDKSIANEDWRAFWADYFVNHRFENNLLQFWLTAPNKIQAVPINSLALHSSICATEAACEILSRWESGVSQEEAQSALNSLSLLDQTRSALRQEDCETFAGVSFVASGIKPIDLTPILSANNGTPPAYPKVGAQICLTFDAYARALSPSQSPFRLRLRLPAALARFRDSTGVFLFDAGALSQPHVESLVSVMRSFPKELHAIVGIIIPEFVGLDPAQAGLSTDGQLLSIDPIPMEASTAPGEFPPNFGQPTAPLFTIAAAQQVMWAVQQTQFTRRPWLANRRDAIIARAGAVRGRHLRLTVPPSMFIEHPDELIPQTAFPWTIDSATAFRVAFEFGRFKETAAMEAVLLLADVLSNGGNTTLLFHSDANGIVSSVQTPLSRIMIDPALEPPASYACNGFAIQGRPWAFNMNPLGAIIGVTAPTEEWSY